ncbi:Methyltranfer-dom domain-containing protein [Fusarium keratoplasticum]|uniref:Methyltranfer-dom domain-containing protein n=1 Tax=Fusarium keratoplasticum TaxID=1328300 RepID=A0ACC0QXR4_9HYPO|nr:Methyltranfer-dom domain-containing protein [Fusarium keratoplasticum]KAI8669048.1 Methyltranfer-dom domain-containing protein [Fusarium keratoplasticum]
MTSFESQIDSAQRMYTPRATDYEDSWHPEYSQRFTDVAPIKPGDHILDLACGTGLDAIIAAERVGDHGTVIGVDVTAAMLEKAREKLKDNPTLARRLTLVQHDVTNLNECPHVQKGSFDLVLCSNAFVLFEHPEQVVAHWREYLKPGGRVVIDITHEQNLPSGVLVEKVARSLDLPFPSNRTWIKSKDSFSEILERQGFVVEKVELVEKALGLGSTYLDLDQADAQFDQILNGPLAGMTIADTLRASGRDKFKQEWENAAVDGKIEVSDILYVYVARKI